MEMRKGLALILVVGVLAVLAVLGSAFAVLSRLERKAASQRVWGTKAWLLARSGLEDAQARLDLGQDSAYAGEDWSDDRILNAGPETDGQVYQASTLNRDDCPASQALRPSFFRSVGGNPRLYTVQGKPRGYSGSLSGEGSTWSLKVLSGGFFVNDTNPQLRRILGVLAEAVGRQEGVGVAQADGERLVDLRPASGWASYAQIRDVALGGSQAKLDVLQPYLVLEAWVDRKVVAPNVAYTTPTIELSWESLKLGHASVRAGSRAPGFEPRAPVDLSWARSRRPALIALMGNLRAAWLDEYGVGTPGKRRASTIKLDWTKPSDDCRLAADRLLASTSELWTWEQWNAFCDSLPLSSLSDVEAGPATSVSDVSNSKRAILKANFNPNTDANKFNPDVSLSRLVDKCDLLVHSTEFSLRPMGGERIVSVGRVLDAQGSLLASRTVSARRAPDRALRFTAQSEFAAEDLGNPDVAGDESGFRAYGNPLYITPSLSAGRTFGHRLLGSSGTSLQTGPEPHTAAPASWDGQLRLATVETVDGEYAPTGTSMMFLARWDDAYDADYSGGGGILTAFIDEYGTPFKDPSLSVWDEASPGQLYPDGCYCDGKDEEYWEPPYSPGYQAPGNLHPHRGTASFWMKPNYDILKFPPLKAPLWDSPRGHIYLNNSRGLTPPPSWGSAMFTLVHANYGLEYYWGQHWESAQSGQDSDGVANGENAQRTPPKTPCEPHRWYLLTFSWDMDQVVANLSARIRVDRGLASNPLDRNDPWQYCVPPSLIPSSVDFTCDDGENPGSGPAHFYLGPADLYPEMTFYFPNQWNSAHATFDELALYDLGPMTGLGGSGDAIELSEKLALKRFEAGRYYKESTYPGLAYPLSPMGPDPRTAGEWFSAPVDLGRVRLKSMSWTQVVPRGLRAPAPPGWPSPPDPKKREDGDPGPDGRIVLELAHPAVQVPALPGAAYKPDASGREIDRLFTDSRGEPLARLVQGAFRLHAVFQPNLQDPLLTAILDPLTLDDVTVSYRPVDQSALSDWREGE